MLSKEENKLLTRVGPGTPMGELFRRFWLPGLLSSELNGPDSVPVRVRLLGEDLIAFRDTDGRVGIIDAYCPHRNAPMFFGRNEEGGLRCIYHGWKFDVKGQCVEMPNCWEGETFKDKVTINWYPAEERAGMVWIYMGPKDKVPPIPAYEWIDAPPENRYVLKFFLECNYLQRVENDTSESHGNFLHRNLGPATGVANRRWTSSTRPADGSIPDRRPQDPRRSSWHDTAFGSIQVTKQTSEVEGRELYSVGTPFYLPSFSNAGGLNAPNVRPMNIFVPVDDENMAFYRFKWSTEPITETARAEMMSGGFEFPDLVPGTFTPVQNKSNDYMIDRNKQRFYNYSGMANTPVQDVAMCENQGGAIADRSKEVLVTTDRGIIHIRKRLMDAAQALMNGVEPSEPWNPEAYGLRSGVTARVEVPAGTPLDEVVALALDPAKEAARADATVSFGRIARPPAQPAPQAAMPVIAS